MWKLIKIYLEGEGIICRSPKNCLKEAYQQGIIGETSMGKDANRQEYECAYI